MVGLKGLPSLQKTHNMDARMQHKDLPRASMERKALPPNYDTSKASMEGFVSHFGGIDPMAKKKSSIK
jgi:hypothetical protein